MSIQLTGYQFHGFLYGTYFMTIRAATRAEAQTRMEDHARTKLGLLPSDAVHGVKIMKSIC